MAKAEERQAKITRVSITSIVMNIALSLVKAAVGAASGSVAIINDAVNNATDSISSLVTMVFYSVGRRRPTRKHPLGYGRMEYLSALVVSMLVIMTGFGCLSSSIDAIRKPQDVRLDIFGYTVVVLSIIAKLFLSRLNKKAGEETDSDALVATGKDALSDALVTGLTLVSALLVPLTGLQLDGVVGIVVALFILWAGISSILETTSSIMGERPDADTVALIRSLVGKHPPLKGGYDMMLHNYGPERVLGTCNVEVPIDAHAEDVFDAMTDAEKEIREKTGIHMTFGLYAVNDYRSDVRQMKEEVLAAMKAASPHVLSLHAFHVHFDTKTIHFDVVIDFRARNLSQLSGILEKAVNERYPDYKVEFTMDPEYD